MTSDIQIQKILKFSTVKSIIMYMKAKSSSQTTQILNLKYMFIDFTSHLEIVKDVTKENLR